MPWLIHRKKLQRKGDSITANCRLILSVQCTLNGTTCFCPKSSNAQRTFQRQHVAHAQLRPHNLHVDRPITNVRAKVDFFSVGPFLRKYDFQGYKACYLGGTDHPIISASTSHWNNACRFGLF